MKVFNVIFNLYGDDAVIDQVVASTTEQATQIALKMYGEVGFVAVREYNGETGTMVMEILENVKEYCEDEAIYDKLSSYGDFYYKIVELLKKEKV